MVTKRRMRRFDAGGTAYDPDQDAADQIAEAAANAPAKKQSFAEAFAAARRNRLSGGPDTFEWAGKKYKSYRAGEEPKAKSETKSESKPEAKPASKPEAPVRRPTPVNRDKTYFEPSRMAKQLRDTAAGSRMDIDQSVGATPAERRKVWPSMKKGGSVSSASKRADGVATKGKTKGRFV